MTPTLPPRLFLLLCFLSLSFSMFSQYKDGFRKLKAGQLDQAYAIFNKNYEDEVDITCSKYGLAQLYANPDFSRYDNEKAYAQLLAADKGFRRLDYKSRKKLVKLINSTDIRTWKKKIVEQASKDAQETNTLDAYNRFLATFDRPSSKTKRIITQSRNKLAFQEATEIHSTEKWEQFIQAYKKDLKTYNPGLLVRAEQALFEAYFKVKPWSMYDSFALKYPNNPVVADAGVKDFIAICGKNQRKLFQEFNKKHPESLLVSLSKDSINAIELLDYRNADDPRMILQFIADAELQQRDSELDEKLSELFRQEPIVNYYLDKLPSGQFEKILPLTTTAIFEEYANWGKLSDLKKFKTHFPDFADTIRLQQEMNLATKINELGTYYQSKKEAYKAFIREAAPRHSAYDALLTIIKPEIDNGALDEALSIIREMKPYFGSDNYWIKNIEDALLNDDADIQKVSLGDSINTDKAEYLPVLSADGQTLYFCGYHREDAIGGEDIYMSSQKNGVWSKAKPVKALCDSYNNEAPFALSTDGTRIFVFISGDMFYHDLTAGGWSDQKGLENVNTSKWECDVNLSSDGKVMFFTSLRDNIISPNNDVTNIDIFVSLKDENGNWGKAFNIGSDLNTPFIDRTPFLHPDMKTLYFSSKGHGSIGDIDVFMTTRLDDTWKNWSQPVNLGKMINTTGRDWGYKISTDGTTAYFAGGLPGKEDIFQTGLPEQFRPEDVSTISGTLTDNEGKPLSADIVVKDLETDEVVGVFKSNPITGGYFFTLPQNKLYGYHIDKEGHFPVSDNLDLRNVEEGEDIRQDLNIVSMDELVSKDISLPLVNLFFDTDKYEIKPESYAELNRLVGIVKANNYQLEVMGHTDAVGSDEYNMKLSQSRAKAVKEYLIKKGCKADKIVAKGFGEHRPDETNETDKGRAQNRRVEVRFKK